MGPVVTKAYARPRAYVRVRGPQAVELLQRILSNDVVAQESCEALILNAKGRVIAPLVDQSSRIPFITHLVDRACLGTCYSYANYEPCSAAFRVRVLRRNPIVVDSYDDSYDMQTGVYRPRGNDPPIYQIANCGESLCVKLLNPEAASFK